MKRTLHLTSGDMAGDLISKTGIPGDVLVWHDLLYDGPRKPGWPDSTTLRARSRFLESLTGGGLGKASIDRWLQERPDPVTGLGKLASLALEAIRAGHETPAEIFKTVAAAETPPQYWGDIALWAKINALADRNPSMVRIEGPTKRLPQWEGMADLRKFRITAM